MVAGSEHVCAQIEEVLGNLRRHAESACGVFRVDDGQVDVAGLAHMADVFADNLAPRAAEDVANEKNVQIQLLAFSS